MQSVFHSASSIPLGRKAGGGGGMTKPAIPRRRRAGPAARAVLPASTTPNSRCPVALRAEELHHPDTKSPDRSGVVSGHFKVHQCRGCLARGSWSAVADVEFIPEEEFEELDGGKLMFGGGGCWLMNSFRETCS